MQRIDLALAARMLHLPHPLLADDVDLELAGRRIIEPDINEGTPDKGNEKQDQSGGGPADLPFPGLLDQVGARGTGAAAVDEAEPEHQARDSQHDQDADCDFRDIERIDGIGVDGGGARPEWKPMVHRWAQPPRRRRIATNTAAPPAIAIRLATMNAASIVRPYWPRFGSLP